MKPKPTYNDEDRLEEKLAVSAAAAIVGVHPETLRRYEAAGHITATRTPGGERRFRRGDVEQLRDNPPKLYVRHTAPDTEDAA